MPALALPDIKRSTPIAVAGNSPVLNIFKPIAETPFAYAFGYPVDGIVIADKIIAHIGHFYKPRFARIVDKRGIAAPAIGIIVLKSRCVEKESLFVQIL